MTVHEPSAGGRTVVGQIKVTWPAEMEMGNRLLFQEAIENQLVTIANQIKTLVPGAEVEGIHVG